MDTSSPITKSAAIAYLREVEKQLFSRNTVKEVKKLEPLAQTEFFSARLGFTNLIGKLNAALMREIREDLQNQAKELKKGIDKLSTSVTKLENAAGWAKAINKITMSIGQIVNLGL